MVDRGLTDTSAQDAYVAGDNTAFGKVPAEYMAKAMGGKGNVVVLRGIPTTIDNQRMDAFTAVMKKHAGIKVLDAKHGNWNRDDAFKVMQDYLTRFKQIDAVWAADDDMAVGVLKAIEQAKRKDIKLVFGGAGAKEYDQEADGRRQAADPGQRDLLAQVHDPDAIKLTAEARVEGQGDGRPRPSFPSVLITKENASKYYSPRTRRSELKREDTMARPVTLFTGQWADLPLSELAPLAKQMGYDGLELACWGDHFDVQEALQVRGLLCATSGSCCRRARPAVPRDRQPPRRARRCAT